MRGGLPPLWRLSVQTGVRGKHNKVELPPDVLRHIISYLEVKPFSLEQLEGLINWCAAQSISKGGKCHEDFYYKVVTKCMSVPPTVRVPLAPCAFPDGIEDSGEWFNYKNKGGLDWTDMFYSEFQITDVLHLRRIANKDIIIKMNEAAKNGKFWSTMVTKCKDELKRLPKSMRGPFLNSNEAQRARWESVFYRRDLWWLRARVALGGPIAKSPDHKYDYRGFVGQFSSNSEESDYAYNFLSGRQLNSDFEHRVNGWIEQGWKFDWVLGSVFKLGVPTTNEVYKTKDEADIVVEAIKHFKYRVNALIFAGAEPKIRVEHFQPIFPRENEYIDESKHYRFRFLKEKVDLLLERKISVHFDMENTTDYSSPLVFMKIIHCFLRVAGWERQFESMLHKMRTYDDYDALSSDDDNVRGLYKKTQAYRSELKLQLCKLIVHLASPEGSNVHEKAKGIVHDFFNESISTSATRELYDCLRQVWTECPNIYGVNVDFRLSRAEDQGGTFPAYFSR